MVDINYNIYTDFVKEIVKSNDLSFFKSHPSYTYMLEHVNEKQGIEYMNYIQTKTNITNSEIETFCKLNDIQGKPTKFLINNFFVSPTSLRYIWQAHLILTHFKSINSDKYDIVEIGGGYGGLCLAIHFFSEKYGLKINSYTIVDLKDPSDLQNLYLNTLPISMNIDFVDAASYGQTIDKKDLFLISNYCFSEINYDLQKKYIEHLFPKVAHGFIAWNMIPVYNFGFNISVTEEIPKTGNLNKIVVF
jgi:hypothetical protein